MWLSEKIRRIVQLNARREFKKYKIKLMTDELDWFDQKLNVNIKPTPPAAVNEPPIPNNKF